MRNARKLGIEAVSLAGYEEWSSTTGEVLRSRPDGAGMITQMRPPPPSQDLAYFVAVDPRAVPWRPRWWRCSASTPYWSGR